MWRDPHEVLNQNGDSHVLTLMTFPYPLIHPTMMAETNVLGGRKNPKGVITTPFGRRAMVKG